MNLFHPGSERLAVIAAQVPSGSRVVDVGTDHARLPVHLVRSGVVTRCIATDLRSGPLRSAERRVAAAGLEDSIDLRCGDGLSTVQPGEVDVVLISGIGGAATAAILGRGVAVLAAARRLVVQPQRAEHRVRQWLRANGWALIAEYAIDAGPFDYEVLVAEPGPVDHGYADCPLGVELAERVGPWLCRDENPRLLARWERERAHCQALRDRLVGSASAKARAKVPDIESELELLTALVRALQWA